MAGTDARFDATQFREAIKFAMNMGLPQDPTERATFHFPLSKTYLAADGTALTTTPRLDQDGNPLDQTIRVRRTASKAPVQIPVAVEFGPSTLDERPVGSFKATKASITILDEHWPQVRDAIEVELGGDRYVISYQHPPIGLFEVTIHTFEAFAVSET